MQCELHKGICQVHKCRIAVEGHGLEKDLLKSALFVSNFDSCVNLADHYQTIFHPVTPGAVPYPSHMKRFEIKMFTFVQNGVMFQDQVNYILSKK